MTENTAEYDSLAGALADAGIVTSLPEIHGSICGVMCVGGIAAAERWLDRSLEEWHRNAQTGAFEDALRGLELNTWRMLSDSEMSFEPLLPDEDEPLDIQVRGIATWCHGFLTGLGFGGLQEGSKDDDLDEIARDFAEISRATLSDEDSEDAEQSGFALAELKEYVRVSVQLVFEKFEAERPDAGGDSIH